MGGKNSLMRKQLLKLIWGQVDITMYYKWLLLAISLVYLSLSPDVSWTNELKGPDPILAQTDQGPVQDMKNNPVPTGSNPGGKTETEGISSGPSGQAPPAIKIQEGTNAEG